MRGHRGPGRLLVALSAAAIVGVGATAVAQTTSAPINDNYADSLEINRPHSKLNHADTIKDVRDTSAATVQSDIFNPPQSGGPAELTTCHGARYGKTVWYDFYPDRDGTVRIRTSGFDNVVSLYTFSTKTFVPTRQSCVHSSSFPNEELDAKVKEGHAYTVQVGGANGAGGQLEFLFDFFAAPPHRLTAQSTLKARATSNGIQLVGLTVSSARAAHVKVSCGGFCRSQTKFGKSNENFPSLGGVQMPAGSKLQIRVTAPHSIGVFIQYAISAGNFTKTNRCLEPGSRRPRRKCH